MALTMVHLLVADRWAAGHGEYSQSPEFYYGAISPDAIHIRDGGDKSRKDEFHLRNWRSPHPEHVIDYWRRHFTPFDVGYGVHVLTDCQWVPRYTRRLPGLFKPEGGLNVERYYNDTFVTDFALYRKTPRLEQILKLIGTARTPADHPLLTANEFAQWRDVILKTYRGECPRHDPPTQVDEVYVLEFVKDSIAFIDEVFAGI
ncbi:MAG: hypothetical protein IJ124_03245 [Clostridia bacterium]|nr:hypothetical protein [Clostridia bacterium]